MMNYIKLFICLVFISGCGTQYELIKVYTPPNAYVCYGYTLSNKIGTTYYFINTSIVTISSTEIMSNKLKKTLITHELFHVLGYYGHIVSDTPSVFTFDINEYKTNFTNDEIKLLKSVKLENPISISAENSLKEETIWAINKVNSINKLFIWKE